MIRVRGKFITLTVMLLSRNNKMLEEIDNYLKKECGVCHSFLNPEEFYDAKHFSKIFEIHKKSKSYHSRKDLIELGKRVYSTMLNTVGIPLHIKTINDLLRWEADSFLDNMDNVQPREFIEEAENYYIIKAISPYPSEAQIGIWLGILEAAGKKNGTVKELEENIYRISW